MSSKKGRLFVIAIIAIAIAIIVWQNLPVTPSEEEHAIEADSTFDVDSNYFPPMPMTAIYLYENELVFANNDWNIMHVFLFIESPTELCEIVAGEMLYYCSFDMASGKVTFSDPFGNMLGPYSFVPGKVSDDAIEFPLAVRYRYLVSEDKKRFYLLLDKQDFSVQFGKSLSFKGIDTDLDSKPDVFYFAPELSDFKEIRPGSAAIFEVDSDEDAIADVKFFVSPKTSTLIEQSKAYRWPVLFWAQPRWRGINLQSELVVSKKAPNGTAIIAQPSKLVIRMPDIKE